MGASLLRYYILLTVYPKSVNLQGDQSDCIYAEDAKVLLPLFINYQARHLSNRNIIPFQSEVVQ